MRKQSTLLTLSSSQESSKKNSRTSGLRFLNRWYGKKSKASHSSTGLKNRRRLDQSYIRIWILENGAKLLDSILTSPLNSSRRKRFLCTGRTGEIHRLGACTDVLM